MSSEMPILEIHHKSIPPTQRFFFEQYEKDPQSLFGMLLRISYIRNRTLKWDDYRFMIHNTSSIIEERKWERLFERPSEHTVFGLDRDVDINREFHFLAFRYHMDHEGGQREEGVAYFKSVEGNLGQVTMGTTHDLHLLFPKELSLGTPAAARVTSYLFQLYAGLAVPVMVDTGCGYRKYSKLSLG